MPNFFSILIVIIKDPSLLNTEYIVSLARIVSGSGYFLIAKLRGGRIVLVFAKGILILLRTLGLDT